MINFTKYTNLIYSVLHTNYVFVKKGRKKKTILKSLFHLIDIPWYLSHNKIKIIKCSKMITCVQVLGRDHVKSVPDLSSLGKDLMKKTCFSLQDVKPMDNESKAVLSFVLVYQNLLCSVYTFYT